MKKIIIENTLIRFDSIDDLPLEQDRQLCRSAFRGLDLAYAAYSKYRVGSAVLLDNGQIVMGGNQENAVYPLGLCAERVAVFSASSQFPDVPVTAIAVTTAKALQNGQLPAFPCGSCRQTFVELENRFKRDIRLMIFGQDSAVYVVKTVKDILPFAFDQKAL